MKRGYAVPLSGTGGGCVGRLESERESADLTACTDMYDLVFDHTMGEEKDADGCKDDRCTKRITFTARGVGSMACTHEHQHRRGHKLFDLGSTSPLSSISKVRRR